MFPLALATVALATTATAAVVPVANPYDCVGNYTYVFEEGVSSGLGCCPSTSIEMNLYCANDGPDGAYAIMTVYTNSSATGCGGQTELDFVFPDNTFVDSFTVSGGSLPGEYTMELDFMVDNATDCTSFDASLTAIPTGSTTPTSLCETSGLEADATCTADPSTGMSSTGSPAPFAAPSMSVALVTVLAALGRKLF